MCELIWKDVEGYNGRYQVSIDGQVRRKRNDGTYFYLHPNKQDDGFYRVLLSTYGGVQKSWAMNRLLAETFIPNPENKPYAIYADGNKENNVVENIIWATSQERAEIYRQHNPNYYQHVNPHRSGVRCITTGQTFEKLAEAAKIAGCSVTTVRLSADQNRPTRKGFHFEWL